jgi:hypothetical protein
MSRTNLIRTALPGIIFLILIAATVSFVSWWGDLMANFPVPDDTPVQNLVPPSPDLYKGAFEPQKH